MKLIPKTSKTNVTPNATDAIGNHSKQRTSYEFTNRQSDRPDTLDLCIPIHVHEKNQTDRAA